MPDFCSTSDHKFPLSHFCLPTSLILQVGLCKKLCLTFIWPLTSLTSVWHICLTFICPLAYVWPLTDLCCKCHPCHVLMCCCGFTICCCWLLEICSSQHSWHPSTPEEQLRRCADRQPWSAPAFAQPDSPLWPLVPLPYPSITIKSANQLFWVTVLLKHKMTVFKLRYNMQ